MFKIGIGPSSSHTMGPWRATQDFVTSLNLASRKIVSVYVDLYSSLAKTGIGHGTDIAIQMGLADFDPVTISGEQMRSHLSEIAETQTIRIRNQSVPFDPKRDIRYHRDEQLPGHPNGMRVIAELDDGAVVQQVYYSVGGGFIVCEGESEADQVDVSLPYPIEKAEDLLRHCENSSLRISEVVRANELIWRTSDAVDAGLAQIRDAMIESIHRGCRESGELPGGLGVRRRASSMCERLLGTPTPDSVEQWHEQVGCQSGEFQRVLEWVSCFALAVNEENAAFGRVVTAPTNGAAGVIPAVLMYMESFCGPTRGSTADFLLCAAEIGCIFKKGATISAAMGGCQAEIGVSSAMAAAALTECLGGSPRQATTAAEIAMEHHLGMTCDPIGGLVQVPCIERNAMGAMKAITAAQVALARDPSETLISLDNVVETMWNTAQDMDQKYKETSDGGLALHLPVNLSEC